MQPHSPLCCEHIYNSACSPFIHCSHLQLVMSLQVFMTPKSVLSIREEEEGGGGGGGEGGGGGGESDRFSVVNEQRLRKAVSDVSAEIGKYRKELEAFATIDEVKQAECECCGLVEDCTQDYIVEVKDSYSDKWVCGLCSEAVKERLIQVPRITMEEAVSSHKDFCQKFNNTTRRNPKLSLTCTMREIVKKSSENRSSKKLVPPRLGRTISCVPRIDASTK